MVLAREATRCVPRCLVVRGGSPAPRRRDRSRRSFLFRVGNLSAGLEMSKISRLGNAGANEARRRHAARGRSEGFTLIELLVTMVILPFIVGALALAIVAVFSLNGTTTGRLADAADAQLLSNFYENDVHSAAQVTTDASISPQRKTGALAAAVWRGAHTQSGGYNTVVSYVSETTSNPKVDELVRLYCTSGSLTPVTAKVVAADVVAPVPSVAVTPVTGSANPACNTTPALTATTSTTSWIPSACVTGVSFSPSRRNQWLYTLVAVPIAATSSGQSATAASSTSCGFATPTSGTYASSLCLVDFSSVVPAQAAASYPANQTMASGELCVHARWPVLQLPSPEHTVHSELLSQGHAGGLLLIDSAINSITTNECLVTNPTLADRSLRCGLPSFRSDLLARRLPQQSYLGNNGYYTGVTGRAALYQTQSGLTTDLYFYGIQVVNAPR